MTIEFFHDISPDAFNYGIFDFDNGIVDTEAVFAVFDCGLLNAVLQQAGIDGDLTPEYVRTLAGHSGGEKLHIIAEQQGFSPEPYLDAFNQERSRLRSTLFQEHHVPLAKGLKALLSHLGQRKALATNKKAAKLFPDMDAMGIRDLFQIIVTSDGLNKKPAPDVILKAMEYLAAEPQGCVYFGDNVSDIEAARAADAFAVGFIIEGLAGSQERIEAMRQAGAHAVTDDYTDVIPLFNAQG